MSLVADVLRAADGDEVAFARVCREPRVALLLTQVAGRFYAPGLEAQDFAQEARLGLLAAVEAWNALRGVDGFLGFAGMVVKRRLQSVLIGALREKHQPLSRADDLDSPAPGHEGGLLGEQLPGGVDPLAVVVAREELAAIVAAAGRLSALERRALTVLMAGDAYSGDKSMDNAIQRVRRKLRAA